MLRCAHFCSLGSSFFDRLRRERVCHSCCSPSLSLYAVYLSKFYELRSAAHPSRVFRPNLFHLSRKHTVPTSSGRSWFAPNVWTSLSTDRSNCGRPEPTHRQPAAIQQDTVDDENGLRQARPCRHTNNWILRRRRRKDELRLGYLAIRKG